MRELILQPGIRFNNLPLVTRTCNGPSDDLERIAVLHNNNKHAAWFSKSTGIVELVSFSGDNLCYRFHISCALWFGIPKEEFEKCLREKLSEILQLVQLANYPSNYLSMCVWNDRKEFVGYQANNVYYGQDSIYPVDIQDAEWEDETGKHRSVK